MGRSCWLAIDERGDETIHQNEPAYNYLHGKWNSASRVHTIKGLSKLLIDRSNEPKCKAVVYELDNVNLVSNKAHVLSSTKIY